MSTNDNETKGKFSPGRITSKVGRYFRDMKGELKKVVWPSKKQVINNTIVVIIAVIIASLVIGGFDTIMSAMVNLLFRGA